MINRPHFILKRVVILVLIIAICMLVTRPPYFKVAPGDTQLVSQLVNQQNTEAIVQLSDEQLYYTTVLLSDISWGEFIQASFNSDYSFINKKSLLKGKTLPQYFAYSQLMMQQSITTALESAYQHLNISYTKQGYAVYVQGVSNHQTIFSEADQLVALYYNGQYEPITSITQLLMLLQQLPLQSTSDVKFLVKDNNQEHTINLSLTEQQRPQDEQTLLTWLGVNQMIELQEVIATDQSFVVHLPNNNVGGPSAGLVMALSFINKIAPEQFNSPYKIAATGTITSDGQVGEIGSLEQKVVSVHEADINLFIVPQSQLLMAQKKAKSIDSAITIVGVNTLSEAITVINQFQK